MKELALKNRVAARLKIVLLFLSIPMTLPQLALGGPLDGSCIVGNTPSATLLFPYFEVDLDNPEGKSTLISINNISTGPAVAKVVMWTDCHLPVLSFDIFLKGNEVATINLRDVIVQGSLLATSPDAAGQVAFPSCSTPLANPVLDGAARADLQAKLVGQPSPADALCYGSDREQSRVAIGFLTVDALNDCSTTIRFPDDEGYFVAGGNGLASNDNVLWGDYYLVDPSEDFAQGYEAVSVVADPDRFADSEIRSFYQVTDDERDDRVPLSSKLRTRFLNGGAFDGSTQFIIWAQRSPALIPFVCDVAAGSCPQATELVFGMDFYNQEAELTGTNLFSPPAFVGRYEVEELGAGTDFGFLDLNSTAPSDVGPPGAFLQRQAWMLQTSSASGRFSVGLTATRLDDLCKPDSGGE